ncbi:acetyltransferase [Sphingomonas sp. 1P06PA]|uniref:acetyltransferase n=1 Tax=Sphingomonas sp. 1P06PA TaxID=554121 RepID=UPI0039A5B3D8
MSRAILFGAGGHARVVLDALLACDPDRSVILLDDAAQPGRTLLHLEVSGGRDWLLANHRPDDAIIPAIGDNRARLALIDWANDRGFTIETVIHPAAVVGREVSLGGGSFLAAGAIVNPCSTLGRGVIVNTAASVDHDCTIGDGVHLAPGVRLCGTVTLGARSLVGVGAVVIPGRVIGADVVIAAGAAVAADIADGLRVGGVPARPFAVPDREP